MLTLSKNVAKVNAVKANLVKEKTRQRKKVIKSLTINLRQRLKLKKTRKPKKNLKLKKIKPLKLSVAKVNVVKVNAESTKIELIY